MARHRDPDRKSARRKGPGCGAIAPIRSALGTISQLLRIRIGTAGILAV
jgi:hypothetical protein